MRHLKSDHNLTVTKQKMKFSIKDFFSKCEQIRRKLHIVYRTRIQTVKKMKVTGSSGIYETKYHNGDEIFTCLKHILNPLVRNVVKWSDTF